MSIVKIKSEEEIQQKFLLLLLEGMALAQETKKFDKLMENPESITQEIALELMNLQTKQDNLKGKLAILKWVLGQENEVVGERPSAT